MKRCFLLLCAVCLTAVASALNVTWLNNGATPGTATVFGEGAAKGDFSIAVKLTLNADFASGSFNKNTSIATFVGGNAGDKLAQGILAYSGEGGIGVHTGTTVGGGKDYAWSGGNAVGNSGTVLIVLTGTWDAANNRWTAAAYSNGTELTLKAGGGSPAFVNLGSGALEMAFATNDAWTFGGVAVYDEVLTQEQITELGSGVDAGLIVEGATILPEPTALALLALGVAGVALRRRAV